MTTEDYVSFETAKLLKEKGFNISCRFAYTEKGHEFNTCVCSDIPVYAYKPTLQMAMKWLREHGWFIHIDIIREASAWLVDVQDIKNDVAIYPVGKEHSSYEEAAEAAIRYCLENLI